MSVHVRLKPYPRPHIKKHGHSDEVEQKDKMMNKDKMSQAKKRRLEQERQV